MVFAYPTNLTGIGDFFSWANVTLDNKLGILILLICYIVPFLALKGSSTDKAFAGASFFGFIIAIFLYRLQFISFTIIIVCMALLILAVLLARSEREKIGL